MPKGKVPPTFPAAAAGSTPKMANGKSKGSKKWSKRIKFWKGDKSGSKSRREPEPPVGGGDGASKGGASASTISSLSSDRRANKEGPTTEAINNNKSNNEEKSDSNEPHCSFQEVIATAVQTLVEDAKEEAKDLHEEAQLAAKDLHEEAQHAFAHVVRSFERVSDKGEVQDPAASEEAFSFTMRENSLLEPPSIVSSRMHSNTNDSVDGIDRAVQAADGALALNSSKSRASGSRSRSQEVSHSRDLNLSQRSRSSRSHSHSNSHSHSSTTEDLSPSVQLVTEVTESDGNGSESQIRRMGSFGSLSVSLDGKKEGRKEEKEQLEEEEQEHEYRGSKQVQRLEHGHYCVIHHTRSCTIGDRAYAKFS